MGSSYQQQSGKRARAWICLAACWAAAPPASAQPVSSPPRLELQYPGESGAAVSPYAVAPAPTSRGPVSFPAQGPAATRNPYESPLPASPVPQYTPPQYTPPQYAPPQYTPPQITAQQYTPPQYTPPPYTSQAAPLLPASPAPFQPGTTGGALPMDVGRGGPPVVALPNNVDPYAVTSQERFDVNAPTTGSPTFAPQPGSAPPYAPPYMQQTQPMQPMQQTQPMQPAYPQPPLNTPYPNAPNPSNVPTPSPMQFGPSPNPQSYPLPYTPQSTPGYTPPGMAGAPPFHTTEMAPPGGPPQLDPRVARSQAAAPPLDGASPTQVMGRPPLEEFEPARILARVNGSPILEGDIIGMVNQILLPKKDELPPDELEKGKLMLTQKFLRNAIEMKMLYERFLQTVPKDKREQALSTAWEQIGKQFTQEELPKLMEQAKVTTPQELDAKLRIYGHSLAKQRRIFGERQLGTYILLQNVDRRPEVTYDEMIEYFRLHEDEFSFKARARWEQLSIMFSKHPDRNEARGLIGQLGDAVFYGTPFAAVAKKGSEGYRASEGGLNDWVQQGSLSSKPLDEALFTLPLNRLSQIIEDSEGYHIIRVVEREDSGKRPFTEAQLEIKEKIQKEKREEQIREFLEKVRAETLVTTIFDDEPDGPLMERE